ncbi:hypothetical protein D3C71_1964820 [compost metagenome]
MDNFSGHTVQQHNGFSPRKGLQRTKRTVCEALHITSGNETGKRRFGKRANPLLVGEAREQ